MVMNGNKEIREFHGIMSSWWEMGRLSRKLSDVASPISSSSTCRSEEYGWGLLAAVTKAYASTPLTKKENLMITMPPMAKSELAD